ARNSRVEHAFAPAIAGAREDAAFVEAVRAVLPELDRVRRHPVAAPMRGAGNVLPLEAGAHRLVASLESLAIGKRAGLVRCPGAELRIAAAAGEIGVALGVACSRDGAFDPDLAA